MGQIMAMAAAQQRKGDSWRKEGVGSDSDLAFVLTSYDEALREAGRAIADAWSAAERTGRTDRSGCALTAVANPSTRLPCQGTSSLLHRPWIVASSYMPLMLACVEHSPQSGGERRH